MEKISEAILPICVFMIFIFALLKKQDAYGSFIGGVQEGLRLFVDIFPSLLAMMLAVNLLRDTGLFTAFSTVLKPIFKGIPSEIFSLCFFRPISGGASMAILINIFQVCGADSLAGKMASVIQGSTDTTLYVLSLYFSTVGIVKIKNALGIGLFADFVGICAGILLVSLFMQ